jgi:hypothetical protein
MIITLDALYSAIDALITGSSSGDALYEAESEATLRMSVDEAVKVVRVDIGTLVPIKGTEDCRKELGVSFTIQCFTLPEEDTPAAFLEAKHLSYDMARQIYLGIDGSNLSGKATAVEVEQIEIGEASIGTILRPCSYIDGVVNPIGEG